VQNIDEARAVEQVYERLTARFPDVALATVRLEVEQTHGRFDRCPVRRYVPVLVERAARAGHNVRLRRRRPERRSDLKLVAISL
jgi:hypothetical protein